MEKATKSMVIGIMAMVFIIGLNPAPDCWGKGKTIHPKDIKMPVFLNQVAKTGAGGTVDLYGENVARLIEKAFPKTRVRVLLGASMDSMKKIESGESELGQAFPGAALWAWKGRKPIFKTPCKNIRYVADLDLLNRQCFMVLKDSDIKTPADLRNKRICPGATGGIMPKMFDIGLKGGYGFGFKDIKAAGGVVFRGPISDGSEMMAAGRLDAVGYGGNHPYAVWMKINMAKGIRLLDWNYKAIDAVNEAYGGATKKAIIPAGTYKGQTKDCVSWATRWGFYASKDIPNDVVYNILFALFSAPENWQDVGLAAAKTFNFLANAKEYAKNPIIPMHPGAAEYWKDRGVDLTGVPIE